MNAFLPGARIGSAHGTLRPVDPETGASDALAYAMYHPAVAFRQPALRDTLREDMAGVPEALLRSRDERAARGGDASPDTTGAPMPVAVPVEGPQSAPEMPQPQATVDLPAPPAAYDVVGAPGAMGAAYGASDTDVGHPSPPRPDPDQLPLF